MIIRYRYLYAKDPYEEKLLFLINRAIVLKHFSDPKAFIEYSNDMQEFIKILTNTIW